MSIIRKKIWLIIILLMAFCVWLPNCSKAATLNLDTVKSKGADAVGMSTAVEAQAANHMGMKICGISFISNLGCGISDQPLSHEEVKEAADQAAPLFQKLVTESIRLMGEIG